MPKNNNNKKTKPKTPTLQIAPNISKELCLQNVTPCGCEVHHLTIPGFVLLFNTILYVTNKVGGRKAIWKVLKELLSIGMVDLFPASVMRPLNCL